MLDFWSTYQSEIISSAVLLVIFLVINTFLRAIFRKIGARSNKNEARAKLISRYMSVLLLLVFVMLEAIALGAKLEDIGLIFSSVFAILGIALFAIWSILSNITSGVIMFLSFPYKVGDKIEIMDKDVPIKAIIEDIRAFQLHLRLENGDLVTYPNNLILQKPVTLVQKDAINEMDEF